MPRHNPLQPVLWPALEAGREVGGRMLLWEKKKAVQKPSSSDTICQLVRLLLWLVRLLAWAPLCVMVVQRAMARRARRGPSAIDLGVVADVLPHNNQFPPLLHALRKPSRRCHLLPQKCPRPTT
jgi:hypothetical protein